MCRDSVCGVLREECASKGESNGCVRVGRGVGSERRRAVERETDAGEADEGCCCCRGGEVGID